MNEHKLSALMRYQGQVKKRLGCTALTIAARFLKYDRSHIPRWMEVRKQLLDVQLPKPRNMSARVLRGNPARNPTALV